MDSKTLLLISVGFFGALIVFASLTSDTNMNDILRFILSFLGGIAGGLIGYYLSKHI